MPTYRVYQVQEQIEIQNWLFVVEAESEDDAIEQAMNGAAKQVEQGTMGEPEYASWGWAARPVNAVEDDTAWDEAIADLKANRRENW